MYIAIFFIDLPNHALLAYRTYMTIKEQILRISILLFRLQQNVKDL
jgi:hypothetical protein